MQLNPEEDGVTHINVYSQGKTELGRFLSNFAYTPFECNDGRFNSVEGYWYWLKTGDDHLRRLSGFLAKKYGRKIKPQLVGQDPSEFVHDFRKKIKDAVIIKINTYRERKQQLINTSLPLEHYYVYGDKAVFPKEEWFIEMLRDIHEAVKEQL